VHGVDDAHFSVLGDKPDPPGETLMFLFLPVKAYADGDSFQQKGVGFENRIQDDLFL